MARIRQFAKDMGLSYNKAKNLVNKGRKLMDGGSSVLESTMNKVKPMIKKSKGGGFPDLSGDGKTTMKDVLIGRGVVEKAAGGPVKVRRAEPKRVKSKRRPQASPSRRQKPKKTLVPLKETLVPFKGVLKTSEGEKLRNVDGKTFVVKPSKSNTQKAKKMRGGGLAIQGLGFRGVR